MKTPRIKIKRVTHSLIDVFHGEMGWKSWSRYTIHKGDLKYVRGSHLTNEDLATVRKEVLK